MNSKNLKDLQNKLDIQKYNDSLSNDKDMCGTYEYCEDCNKKNKYPCASAYNKNNKKKGRK